MNADQAIRKMRPLLVEQERLADLATACALRHESNLQLYTVACAQGDEKRIEELRLVLHSELDGVLDARFAFGKLARDIVAIRHAIDE